MSKHLIIVIKILIKICYRCGTWTGTFFRCDHQATSQTYHGIIVTDLARFDSASILF